MSFFLWMLLIVATPLLFLLGCYIAIRVLLWRLDVALSTPDTGSRPINPDRSPPSPEV